MSPELIVAASLSSSSSAAELLAAASRAVPPRRPRLWRRALPAPAPSVVPASTSTSTSTSTTASSRRGYPLLSWLAPFGLLALWELLARAGVIQSNVLPAPSSVFATARALLESGELQVHLRASLHRAVLGFTAGALVGFALGVLVGFFRLADALLDRNLQMVRAVPFLAIIPLVIVWFGVGETSKVVLIGLGSLFPMYLNTVLGIRQVDPKLLEMGRAFGLGRGELILHTILPGALPSILNGLRLGLTISWLALVGAESFGATAGIGFMATNAREFLQTDVMVLVIVLYAFIGMAADLLARALERRLVGWHPSFAKAGS
jgi:sulfonate transport system permease protein